MDHSGYYSGPNQLEIHPQWTKDLIQPGEVRHSKQVPAAASFSYSFIICTRHGDMAIS